MAATGMVDAGQVEAVRSFNRFYTRQIGLLREGLLETAFSLTQARVLYELGTAAGLRPMDLVERMGIDAAHLSRILRRFEAQGLLERTRSSEDGRSTVLALTAAGRKEFRRLDRRSSAEVGEMLAGMSQGERERLAAGMGAIRELLGDGKAKGGAVTLRAHRPGDIGWVVARHGEVYAKEYGWDVSFEGLVAEIAGRFLNEFRPESERCWIAEKDGERVGCVFLVRSSAKVAKLRLLLVEPTARGLGVGKMLVRECVEFARSCGYRKLTLWTNDVLTAARKIYVEAGFVLVKEERHQSFGKELVGLFWEMGLLGLLGRGRGEIRRFWSCAPE